jgi:hypothetical protein
VIATSRREKNVEKALFLKDCEAELLSPVLEEVKKKTLEKSETSPNDLEALKVLVSYFENAEKVEPDKETPEISVNPKSKGLFLGHIIGRGASADAASGSEL